jgi:thiol-disulfide isomerase/thioredoxin
MPGWTARTVDGKAFDVADMRGSVVLINIWATWCGPCRYEIPELVKLHAEWAPQGFAVLGASIDGRATVGEVEPMMRSFKINYPVVIDTDARIADIFETSVIPTSALIDRNGKVVWTRIGTLHADDAEMVAAIRAALATPRA